MSQADVLSLVNLLSNQQADATVTPGLYNEVVQSWGPEDYLSTYAQIQIPAEQQISLPVTLLHLIGLAWNNTMLSPLNLRELESLNHNWRNEVGSPIAYTVDEVSAKTVALYPTPVQPSTATTYNITSFHSEIRTNVPQYWELPLALLILEREFVRESNHRDPDFALAAGNLGRMLLSMVA